ncbi:Phosphatidylinositol-4-phosphate 5-Kinase [Phytophthora infestans]|uniref:Phosphatidylinositol-4-phosphate 5-Kinase n=1 Tax=Phytophthora infestans TaxID=4787 RepID=A0A833SYJ3_PHYIN|nr:Phosphatidylinositol-4-phosphate 5-Kinase [Phytophthora infestans]
MDARAGHAGPPRRNSDEFDIATGNSAFSVSPHQSSRIMDRSVGDTGTSNFSVSPSPLSSPMHSVLRPPVNITTTSPPSEPSTGSADSQSPLKSALRNPNSPQKPKITRRVSIEHNVQVDAESRRQRDRLSSSQHSAASSESGLGDSGVSLRFRRTPPNSKTSHRSSFAMRDTVLSRMSSNVGTLRESFFGVIGRGTTVNDPLELSPNQEFDLDVIDESGGLDENIGQILKPQVDFSNWSKEGYIVLSVGVILLVIMIVLAETVDSLNGYKIDPGLVFGSLLTLILCVCVFVTYHGVQSYQRHPNPLIYYKCVIDIFLALRFLLDPMLLDMGVYRVNDDASCAYLSGVTQFLYLSSDCWYFAQIVDLYWSLTNPFMSVKANRRRFKTMVYSAGAFTGIFAALVPSVHGLADGNYCWTKRKTTDDPVERDFFHLNRGSWLLFYMWMILFYISGIAVLVFGVKRLRSGLRDTLQSRREMLRNGALSISSYTIYWTIVFIWYALSFQTRTAYDEDGNLPPSHVFRAFTFALSARGAVDYFVWFMINSPSLIRPNWLKFSSDSADKQFSAQLNTALQEELIYFTIEGMTRAIQIAEEDLNRIRDRSPTQELVLGVSDDEGDRTSLGEAATTATGVPGAGSSSNLLHSMQRNRMLTSITEAINAGLHRNSSADADARRAKKKLSKEPDFSFDIPQEQRSMQSTGDRRVHNPSSASTAPTTSGQRSPTPAAGTTATTTASIRFTPYRPQAFAELRQAYGIKAADFMKSFQTSTKPNISEGASGAFMFFSGDKKYIVKSMAEEEARFLCEIADKYAEYLTLNPSSLVTKFYGCFKITMYDKRFYFIVMENLFDVMEEGVQIHHRFDVKGSWVNRSYKRPRRGAKVKCRHCSMMFKYGAKKSLLQCPNVVGLHEPNVVLKDNDLRTRMRIGTEEGVELYEQLRDDSMFLCDLGIMDYSLLLGVMDIEFVVDQPSRPLNSSVLSERTAANTATNTASNSISNDSFISASSSSNWSSSTGSSSSLSKHIQLKEEEVKPPKKLSMSVAPSVHSLFNQPEDPLNQSRYPSAGGEPRPKRSMRKSKRVFGPGYYYVGIIDILQTWTLQKRLERFWKVDVQQKDGEGLSAIDPVRYQRRFEAKLREIISIPKEYHHRQRRNQPKTSMFQSVQRLSPVLQAAAAFESAAAAQEARRDLARARGDSTDTDTSGTSSSTAEDGDLEQAGRNPQPILLPFNQRLISTNSTRSQLSVADLV